MDRDFGSKPGSGGVASRQNDAIDRRERLRKLALETIDLTKDPYFMRNHLGSYECKLCLTLHNNEGNYLAHTQGKRHQQNLARRAAREAKDAPALPAPQKKKVTPRKTVKIGRPGYKVTKQRDPETGQRCLLFQIEYLEIDEEVQPRHRFMSSYEQRVEAPDKSYQYLLFAAEPYETISFKIPNKEIDKTEGKFFTQWDKERLTFSLQLHFKDKTAKPGPGTGQAPGPANPTQAMLPPPPLPQTSQHQQHLPPPPQSQHQQPMGGPPPMPPPMGGPPLGPPQSYPPPPMGPPQQQQQHPPMGMQHVSGAPLPNMMPPPPMQMYQGYPPPPPQGGMYPPPPR